MKYVEIVIQVRDTENLAIYHHHHFEISPTDPILFAASRAAEALAWLTSHNLHHIFSNDYKPCSICYSFPKEKPRDTTRSKKPENR